MLFVINLFGRANEKYSFITLVLLQSNKIEYCKKTSHKYNIKSQTYFNHVITTTKCD